MSKAEIIAELPKLTPEERAEIQACLDELAGQGWLDDGELTDEQKRLLDSRLDDCDRMPSRFVPWEQAKVRIQASFDNLAVLHAARHDREWKDRV